MAENDINEKKEELIQKNLPWSMNQPSDSLSESYFHKVPNEILLHIFRYLSVHDLCTNQLVCRSFRILGDMDEIWKYKCETQIKLLSKSYKQMYIEWNQEKKEWNSRLEHLRSMHWSRIKHTAYHRPQLPVRSVKSQSSFMEVRNCVGLSSLHHTNALHSVGGFHQHPNSTSRLTIKLSVDIDFLQIRLISLWKKATVLEQEPAVLKQMIQRYYRFMQLKASQPENILLIPTLDIEIVWQSHLCRPKIYRDDCVRLFDRVIHHSLITKHEAEKYLKQKAFIDTSRLYEQTFGEQYCSTISNPKVVCEYIGPDQPNYLYWDRNVVEFSSKEPENFENLFSFNENDILIDFKWFDQCKKVVFETFKKVLGDVRYPCQPFGRDLDFRAFFEADKSYERFLYMATKYPFKDRNGFIPSAYAIDFVWRCHMQETLKYEADCLRLVGYVIDHNPQLTTGDEEMKKISDGINQIWKDEFQCEIETDHLFAMPYNANA